MIKECSVNLCEGGIWECQKEVLELAVAEYKAKYEFMLASAQQNAKERDALEAQLAAKDAEKMADLIGQEHRLGTRIELLEIENARLEELLVEGYSIINELVPGESVWLDKTKEALAKLNEEKPRCGEGGK